VYYAKTKYRAVHEADDQQASDAVLRTAAVVFVERRHVYPRASSKGVTVKNIRNLAALYLVALAGLIVLAFGASPAAADADTRELGQAGVVHQYNLAAQAATDDTSATGSLNDTSVVSQVTIDDIGILVKRGNFRYKSWCEAAGRAGKAVLLWDRWHCAGQSNGTWTLYTNR
jgi:hypothetical protein